MSETAIKVLPHVNSALNALAAVLLIAGLVLIKRGHEKAHRWTMLTCFGVSTVFLACYLTYHQLLYAVTGQRGRPFEHPSPTIRGIYLTILVSHVVLAAAVPFLAARTIYLGLRDRRAAHRRLARWTFPIWLYVSVTGVVVYLLLYHIYRSDSAADTIQILVGRLAPTA